MIEITETASRKIRTLMAKQGLDEGGLRVGVKGGGCSGLSYTFSWEKQARLGDQVVEGAVPLERSGTVVFGPYLADGEWASKGGGVAPSDRMQGAGAVERVAETL